MARNKYRFPDRITAENAEASAREESACLRIVAERVPDAVRKAASSSHRFSDPETGTEYRMDVFDRKYTAIAIAWQTSDNGTFGDERLLWARDIHDARREYANADAPNTRAFMYATDEALVRYNRRCQSTEPIAS